jgi:hypothetical protein
MGAGALLVLAVIVLVVGMQSSTRVRASLLRENRPAPNADSTSPISVAAARKENTSEAVNTDTLEKLQKDADDAVAQYRIAEQAKDLDQMCSKARLVEEAEAQQELHRENEYNYWKDIGDTKCKLAKQKETESKVSTTSGPQVLDTAKVEALVGLMLKDPYSAHFRNLTLFNGNICGEVNAKTAAGGYAGFAPFLIMGDKVFIIDDSPTPDTASAQQKIKMARIALACFRGGVSL